MVLKVKLFRVQRLGTFDNGWTRATLFQGMQGGTFLKPSATRKNKRYINYKKAAYHTKLRRGAPRNAVTEAMRSHAGAREAIRKKARQKAPDAPHFRKKDGSYKLLGTGKKNRMKLNIKKR